MAASPRSISCPTLPSGASSPRPRGEGAIHRAAREGDLTFIQSNLRFDIADGQGRFPLHIAAIHGQVEVVAFFLKNAPDFLPLTSDGKSALHLAASYGKVEVVRILPSTLLGLQDSKGRTALYDAVKNSEFDSASALLERGEVATLSILDLAVKREDKAMAHLLLTSQAPLFEEAINHYKRELGDILLFLGHNLIELDSFTEAVSAYESALLVYQRVHDPLNTAEALMCLGVAHLNLDQPEKAIEYYRSAQLIYEPSTNGARDPNMARVLKLIAIAQGECGRLQESIEYFDLSLSIYKQIEGSDDQIASILELIALSREQASL